MILIPILAGALVMKPARAEAQVVEGIAALGALIDTVSKVYQALKGAYDFYQWSKTWGEPDVTTADLINAAVAELQRTIINVDVKSILQDVQTDVIDYSYAASCSGSDCGTKWQKFDSESYVTLSNIESSIKSGPDYANALGIAYNLLLPLYLQSHVSGDKWGVIPLPGSSSLLDDFKTVGQRAFGINYNMIGASTLTVASGTSPFSPATDSRKKSQLFNYVKSSSVGGHQNDHCFGDDNICLVFLQTNPTAQAVQKAQTALYGLLSNLVANLNYVKDAATSTTVIVDVANSWGNNWQGYANSLWTSMQDVAYGSSILDNTCPDGMGIVGIWQIPKAWAMSFLCQPIPGYPAWIPGTSTAIWPVPVVYACSGSPPLCNYDLQCTGPDFVLGGGSGSQINCYHRQDGQTNLPPKGVCSHVDYTFANMPATGAFYALPGGNYLTGYNMTLYNQNRKTSTYYYCGSEVSSGSLGAPMTLGTVGGVSYPANFNVFTFGNVTGLRDVQGPVAAGGSVQASSFNINWGQLPVGIVATGNLTLQNGTVMGSIYHGAVESIQGVTYNTAADTAGTPIDFGTARTKLRDMSTALAKFPANGATTIAYGNITLTGRDPGLNVFSLDVAALGATYSITINAPSSSTVIINVNGTSPRMANIGFTNYVSVSKLLWNFFQATTLYASSIGIPGSVLAPFANASLGGNIGGTLISESCLSTNEFHQAPFVHNWLVP